jgi:hypothetical protein
VLLLLLLLLLLPPLLLVLLLLGSALAVATGCAAVNTTPVSSKGLTRPAQSISGTRVVGRSKIMQTPYSVAAAMPAALRRC